MNIREAIMRAAPMKAFITRSAAARNCEKYRIGVIQACGGGDTYAHMTLDERGNLSNFRRNWAPTADDLMADDWEVLEL